MCIGMTWRRLIAAGVVREWKPKLEEVFREADQFGVAVAGGVERVAMKAQVVHQTGHWIVATDCSNAFNTLSAPPSWLISRKASQVLCHSPPNARMKFRPR